MLNTKLLTFLKFIPGNLRPAAAEGKMIKRSRSLLFN
jgi:hypothetical protein